MNNKSLLATALVAVMSAAVSAPQAQTSQTLTEAERHALAAKTEVWTPVPAVVKVADAAAPQAAPSDALVLLGATSTDLAQWRAVNSGKAAEWTLQNGEMTVKPGTGDIQTVENFCDIQLHLEWRTTKADPAKTGQMRNNSGIFLQEKYEIQILDSYQNATYPNGQAGAVYKQTIPLVNAMRPDGQWQQYDIIYRAPRFAGDKRLSPGFVTVLHNGVLVQNHTEILGTTEWIGPPQQPAHGCAPLKLQDHGDKVSFRNIWVRKLD